MDLSNYPSKAFNGVSLVIPVMNEEGNIDRLIQGILQTSIANPTMGIKEIIFVDDGSTDKTKEIIAGYAENSGQLNIILKERFVKRGTVNAQLYGISQASYNAILIMDGDLQHPVSVLPSMVKKYKEGYDMVLGSRYVKGGTAERTIKHGLISRGANLLAKSLLPWTYSIKDPISGFLIVNRRIVPYSIEMDGFNKLALYILTCKRTVTVAEVPFDFKERKNGNSKVANGGIDFMVKYLKELKYYRFLRQVVRGRHVPSPSSSEYELFRQE